MQDRTGRFALDESVGRKYNHICSEQFGNLFNRRRI